MTAAAKKAFYKPRSNWLWEHPEVREDFRNYLKNLKLD